MMKQNVFLIIFSICAILVFGILTDYFSAQRSMEDKDKLEKSILENKNFASAQYTFPLYSKEEINVMMKDAEKSFEGISADMTQKHLSEYKKVIEKQRKTNQYFYMKK